MWLMATVVAYEAGDAHAVWINSIVYSCTVMKCLHPILDCACEYGWWDYDVTGCNHQCADEHGNSGVLKGVLNLQSKLLLRNKSHVGLGAFWSLIQ